MVQQRRAISGKVTDTSGAPLPGVTVVVKETTQGTITNNEGTYSLSNVPGDATLVFSFVGMKTQEKLIGGQSTINIVLEEETFGVDEVVVVGYGIQKKINLTGAVSSISNKELESKPVVNVVEAIQGTTPGLVIQQSNSQPGNRPSINIRGLKTLNNNDPLVMIDGIIGDIQNVNPSDIESISVLKDASSTAIYGSRASNGVILITTKKGKSGKSEVVYDLIYGMQEATFLPKIVDSWVYTEMRNEALVNSGRPIAFSPEQIEYYRSGEGPNVNWMKEIYKTAAPLQSHALSVNGGNDKTTFMASLGYLNQASLLEGPNYALNRYNGRLNVVHQLSDRLKINTHVAYARNEIKDHAYWTEWIVEQATRMPSIYPIVDENGNYTLPSGSNTNALARLETGGYRMISNDDLSGSVSAELEIIDNLKLKGMLGGQLYNNRTHENRKAIAGTGDSENRMTEYFGRTQNITSNLILTYDKVIGSHTFGALAGYSYEGGRNNSFSTYRITERADFDIPAGSQTEQTQNEGWANDWSIYSGFFRLNYNYKEKYLFEFNIRDDFSSKFAKGNRSAVFPSMSGAWRISEESFYGDFKKYVPSLKLRSSWGLVGNNRIDDYQYQSTVSITNGYNFGSNIVNVAGFSSVNADLKWETTRMFNVGADAGLLNNTLNLTFDYFHNMTYDILVNLPVPGTYGGGAPIQNAGKVKNYGWEISATHNLKLGDFRQTISVNVSDSRNEVVDTKGTEWINGLDVNTIIREGYPINSYYAYRWNGFFQNPDEVAKGPHLDGITPKPGDIRYVDKDGDGLVKEDDDRFILGNSFPRYTYGFNYTLSWKNFDFSMLWQGVGKRSVWLRGESVEAFHNNNEGPVFDFHLDRWTPNHPNASYPRLTVGSESANNAAKSNFWIEDAAYLRLKNAQLGYTIPRLSVQKIGIQNFRIFASVQNALTFTDMKGGWDPETTDGGGRIYPVARTFSLGLNLKF
ncbi:MAG: SusC/RagA family TonB-linked outer membrane protein [Mangrovibacterium sp.]